MSDPSREELAEHVGAAPEARDSRDSRDGPASVADVPKESAEFTIRCIDGVYIDGKRDSGKTVLTRHLIRTLPYKFWVLDVIGNLEEFKDRKAYPNVEYYLVNPHDASQVEPIFQKILAEGRRMTDYQKKNGLPIQCGMLVMDEADRYDYFTNVKSDLSDIVNLARNYGIGYIATARRTAAVAKDILANADWLLIFRNVFKRDQKILAEWIDVEPITLRDLDEHEFLIIYHGEAIGRTKLEHPE